MTQIEEKSEFTATEGQTALSVRELWKIFGDKADKVIGTPDAELSRKELQAKTGCVTAVKDVSFDVAPGEVFVVMLRTVSNSAISCAIRNNSPLTRRSLHVELEDDPGDQHRPGRADGHEGALRRHR